MAVKITVIGMDPLGQSLALALKHSERPLEVVVTDRSVTRLDEAAKAEVAHRVEWTLGRAIEGASLIFVNEPLHQARETLEFIGTELENEAVVTDTGSHKGALVEWASALLPEHIHFVGSTPLIGATQPNPLLFQKQRYAVVTLPDTPPAALRLLSDALTLTGAELLFMELVEHDTLMSAVVQLPAMMGAALLNVTAQNNAWRDLAMMADLPYRNATHLPYDDAAALSHLLRHSREPLLHWLGRLEAELGHLRALVEQADEGTALETHLAELLQARQRWNQGESSADAERTSRSMDEIKALTGFGRLFGRTRRGGEGRET